MREARVVLFKPSGKYYTEEEWEIPADAIRPIRHGPLAGLPPHQWRRSGAGRDAGALGVSPPVSGGVGMTVECINCAKAVQPENEHLGSQGWLCQTSPNSLRGVTLVIAALAASNEEGVS